MRTLELVFNVLCWLVIALAVITAVLSVVYAVSIWRRRRGGRDE